MARYANYEYGMTAVQGWRRGYVPSGSLLRIAYALELSDRDKAVLELMAYVSSHGRRGDWLQERDKWGWQGLLDFMARYELESYGCKPKDVTVVSFTLAQASKALGYPSERGARSVIDRAVVFGLLARVRKGTKGQATLYALTPIGWESSGDAYWWELRKARGDLIWEVFRRRSGNEYAEMVRAGSFDSPVTSDDCVIFF